MISKYVRKKGRVDETSFSFSSPVFQIDSKQDGRYSLNALSSIHNMMVVVFKTFCVGKGESYFIRDGAFFVPSHLDNNQGFEVIYIYCIRSLTVCVF